MKRIVLISCVSKKLNRKSRAEDLYISPLFKKNLDYAKSLNPDNIFILSAKHGLVKLHDEIEPYDLTLNQMKDSEIQSWAKTVLDQLQGTTNLNCDEFIFLAGLKYRKYLVPYIKNYLIPMEGLRIGEQLKWLSER